MSDFKVGDRVRVKANIDIYRKGEIGSIIGDTKERSKYSDYDWDVQFDVPGVSVPMLESEIELLEESPMNDEINHPSHYTSYKGIEVIQLTEQLNFNRGNAIKYIARAGLKNPATEVEDLEKSAWYIHREIQRLEKNA